MHAHGQDVSVQIHSTVDLARPHVWNRRAVIRRLHHFGSLREGRAGALLERLLDSTSDRSVRERLSLLDALGSVTAVAVTAVVGVGVASGGSRPWCRRLRSGSQLIPLDFEEILEAECITVARS